MCHGEAAGRFRLAVPSDLLLDPLGGYLHSISEDGRRRPAQFIENSGVVRVAPVHALRLREVVLSLQVDLHGLLDHVDQLVDRH